MKICIKFIFIIVSVMLLLLSCSLSESSPPEKLTPSPKPTPTLPTPVISANISDTEIFINFEVELTASGSGANVTYHWSIIGGGSLNLTTGVTVTYKAPSMPGLVTVNCIAIDENDTESAEASISFTLYNMKDSVLWLDAMDPGSFETATGEFVIDGMGIEIWNDKSGNTNNAEFNASGWPVYCTNEVNERSSVRFHEVGFTTNPFFNISGNTSLDLSEITFFIIAKQSGFDTVNGQAHHTIMAMDSGFSLSANAENTTFSFTINDAASASFSNTFIANYAVIAGVYDPTAEVLGVWIDGGVVASASYDLPMNCSGNLHIGGNGVDGVLEGYIGEVIIFDKVLSDDQILFISEYLSGKWGMFSQKNVTTRLR